MAYCILKDWVLYKYVNFHVRDKINELEPTFSSWTIQKWWASHQHAYHPDRQYPLFGYRSLSESIGHHWEDEEKSIHMHGWISPRLITVFWTKVGFVRNLGFLFEKWEILLFVFLSNICPQKQLWQKLFTSMKKKTLRSTKMLLKKSLKKTWENIGKVRNWDGSGGPHGSSGPHHNGQRR